MLEPNAPIPQRLSDLRHFYTLMDELARRTSGPHRLCECSGRLAWPMRGVYFFMEPGELRRDSGNGLRIVRVGTHALRDRSHTTLWQRLSQHKGRRSGSGNHRGSIFRQLVGAAVNANDPAPCLTWGQGKSVSSTTRTTERSLEQRVSAIIGEMSFLLLHVDDDPAPHSLRGVIERNAIALLSNAGKPPLDAASAGWLGTCCPRPRVQTSHLWNQNHVDEGYDPAFLETFAALVRMDRCT